MCRGVRVRVCVLLPVLDFLLQESLNLNGISKSQYNAFSFLHLYTFIIGLKVYLRHYLQK